MFVTHRISDGICDCFPDRGYGWHACHTIDRINDREANVLIGYMRVSKADGSQVLDLQRDALLAADVKPSRLYEDQATGKKDDRPGLEA